MLHFFSLTRALCAALTLLFVAILVSPSAAAPQTTDPYPKLFGSQEIKSSKLKKFRKWNDVIARYNIDNAQKPQKCRPSRVKRCSVQKWSRFLKKIKSLPLREQIDEVNTYFNRHQYIIDPVNWGKKDYWATPLQFFNKNGDCEDYAISKYISLRKLGVPVKDMRIVVLRDLNLKIAHAILVVYHQGKPLILDNQISQVVTADRIRHYQPIYSINETNWWLHRS